MLHGTNQLEKNRRISESVSQTHVWDMKLHARGICLRALCVLTLLFRLTGLSD